MPHQMTWLVKDRVILSSFSGSLSKGELVAFISEIRLELQHGQAPIYHISNSLELTKVEFSLADLQTLTQASGLVNLLNWQIDINRPKALTTMLAAIAAQFIKLNVRTVASLAEAVTFIKQTDPTLAEAAWQLPQSPPTPKGL
jgi:hypothetical protein